MAVVEWHRQSPEGRESLLYYVGRRGGSRTTVARDQALPQCNRLRSNSFLYKDLHAVGQDAGQSAADTSSNTHGHTRGPGYRPSSHHRVDAARAVGQHRRVADARVAPRERRAQRHRALRRAHALQGHRHAQRRGHRAGDRLDRRAARRVHRQGVRQLLHQGARRAPAAGGRSAVGHRACSRRSPPKSSSARRR